MVCIVSERSGTAFAMPNHLVRYAFTQQWFWIKNTNAHEHVTQVQTYLSGATHSGTKLLHTPLALPVDLGLTKHLTGNDHAVAVIPDVAGITLCKLIILFFWHAA